MGDSFFSPYQRGKLKFAAAGLAAAIPSGAVLFLLYGVVGLRQAWVWYISGLLFYTIFAFWFCLHRRYLNSIFRGRFPLEG
jgi:hypothetical protein